MIASALIATLPSAGGIQSTLSYVTAITMSLASGATTRSKRPHFGQRESRPAGRSVGASSAGRPLTTVRRKARWQFGHVQAIVCAAATDAHSMPVSPGVRSGPTDWAW